LLRQPDADQSGRERHLGRCANHQRAAVGKEDGGGGGKGDPRIGSGTQPRHARRIDPRADAAADGRAPARSHQGGQGRGRECPRRGAQPPSRSQPATQGRVEGQDDFRRRRSSGAGRYPEAHRPLYRRDRQIAAAEGSRTAAGLTKPRLRRSVAGFRLKCHAVEERMLTSPTQAIPESGAIPRHVAIIMDGNGRWAKQRFMPRIAGHRRGAEAVRATVRACAERGIGYLTLFAFSSENWRRPQEEVSMLKQLFRAALENEVAKLHEYGIRLRVIGDIEPFGEDIVKLAREGEALTADNTRLTLTIAANYGGRWDLLQAMNRMVTAHPECAGRYTEADLAPYLSMNYAPEPDLFIRTGGEQRISKIGRASW